MDTTEYSRLQDSYLGLADKYLRLKKEIERLADDEKEFNERANESLLTNYSDYSDYVIQVSRRIENLLRELNGPNIFNRRDKIEAVSDLMARYENALRELAN